MDVESGRDGSLDLPEKPQEFLLPMTGHTLVKDFAGRDVQGGKEGGGSVTLVIVRHRSRSALLQRKAGLCGTPGMGGSQGVRVPPSRFSPSELRRYILACGVVAEISGVTSGDGCTKLRSDRGAPPTWLNLFCLWLWENPLAWFLAYNLGWRANGVFVAIRVAFSTIAVASGVLFRREKWKAVAV